MRWLVLLWLASAALVSIMVAGAQAQQPVAGQRAGATHLRHAGFWPEPVGAGWQAPATPPPDVLGGTVPWDDVALPHSRARSMAESSDTATALPQVVWYRLQVPAGAAPADSAFLYLPRWQTIGGIAVYADGQLVHRSRGSRVWNSFNRPLWVPLADAQGAPAPSTVLVRMASQQGVGGAISTAWVGGEGELLWRYQVRSWLQADFTAMAAGAFVVIGIFAFAVWCVRRSEVMYVLFFATSVANALRMVQFTMGDVPLPISDDWFGWLTANSLGWSLVCVFLFTVRVHGLRMPRVERVIIAIVTAVSVVTLPWLPLRVETVLPAIYLCIVGVTLIVAASGMWASWVNRSPWAMVLSLWVSLTVPASIYDTLMASYPRPQERPARAAHPAGGADQHHQAQRCAVHRHLHHLGRHGRAGAGARRWPALHPTVRHATGQPNAGPGQGPGQRALARAGHRCAMHVDCRQRCAGRVWHRQSLLPVAAPATALSPGPWPRVASLAARAAFAVLAPQQGARCASPTKAANVI